MATLSVSDMLAEARAAYHALQTGRAIASCRDSNGEEIRYSAADRGALASYIATLEDLLNQPIGTPPVPLGPMRFSF